MKFECVTLWHKENDGSYKRILFEHSNVTKHMSIKTLGSEKTENNSMLVRLFCLSPCGVRVGDKLCQGYDASGVPPEDSYIITDLEENFKSSARLRHYKAACV